MIVKWLGEKKCDLCGTTESDYFVDGRMSGRSCWAFMCALCWGVRGAGKLGTGCGQKYDGVTLTKIGG